MQADGTAGPRLTGAMLQVLPDIMAQAEACVHGCRQEHRGAVCGAMLQVIGASNDYTRKVACVQFYQDLAAASNL